MLGPPTRAIGYADFVGKCKALPSFVHPLTFLYRSFVLINRTYLLLCLTVCGAVGGSLMIMASYL